MTLSRNRSLGFAGVHSGPSDRAGTLHSARYHLSLRQHARLFDHRTRFSLSAIGALTPHVSGELGDCPYSLRPINSAFSRGWYSHGARNRFHSWLDWFCTGIHPVNVWG